jgi:hypothetical protein
LNRGVNHRDTVRDVVGAQPYASGGSQAAARTNARIARASDE